MLALAVLLSEIIILGKLPPVNPIIIFSLLVPIFTEMGAFALNDYADIETDRHNKKKDRPLVKGTINPKFAFSFSWLCFGLSIIFSFFINLYAFLIALIFNLLSVGYNYKLKDLPLVGNIYIASTMAIPFLFGNFVLTETLNPFILLLTALAFLSGLAREIIKSVQDMKGDKRARRARTFPIIVGKKKALQVAAFLYFSFLVFTLALLLLMETLVAAVLLFFVALFFSGEVIQLIQGKQDKIFLETSRKFSLFFLFLGLMAVLIEVLL